ncbi:DUF6584 family protein, partial [Marichromatium gracile]
MTDHQGLYDTAMRERLAGNERVAEPLFRALLALAPEHSTAWYELGSILVERGDLDGGVACLRKARLLDPDKAQYRTALADAQCRAAPAPESAVEPPPAATLGEGRVPLVEQQRIAGLLERSDRLDKALSRARALTEHYPDDAFAWRALGTVHYKRGESQAALDGLWRALARTPDHAETLNTLANALLDLGFLNQARGCVERALILAPDYASAHNTQGMLFRLQERFAEAEQCYSHAIMLQPQLAEAHSNLGVVYKELGRLDEALDCYRQALAINPDYFEALNNMGAALQDLGRHDAALSCFNRALTGGRNLPVIESTRLFTLNYHPDLPAESIYAAYRDYNRRHGEPAR